MSLAKNVKECHIDITLLKTSFERTPTERVRVLQDAVAFAGQLRLAGRGYYAKLRKNKAKKAMGGPKDKEIVVQLNLIKKSLNLD